ncbi:MAG: Uma2 family endonuclease [Acidimicrobiales bacterium]|nr:MAG: Uma2 family endonuclease [Acidimicrobiales bacterium]
MSSALELLPNDRPWTVEDLERLPDDGNRYEITNGSLLVTPAPAIPHVVITANLAWALRASAPKDLAVIPTGAGVQLRRSMYIPDIVVVHAAATTREGKLFDVSDVVLVVEVLSPSNAGTDLVLKRHDYAADGIAWYWIVDPAAQTLTVLENSDGSYLERQVVQPGAQWATDQPFPFSIDPGKLR